MSRKADPIKKQILVAAPQERAFRVFTEGIDSWWPREHGIGKLPIRTAVLEPRANGRWYEVGADGSESEWGKVLVWDPPRRLVLAWQITADWKHDPALVTEVEVIFTPQGPSSTRVDLEHRDLERFGAQEGPIRKIFESPGGWPGLLAYFAQASR